VLFGAVLLAALGVGTLLAALNVAYRDFRYVVPFMLQLWMFATPSVYMQIPAEPGAMQALLACNPMVALIEVFRAALLGGPISWGSWSVAASGAILVFGIGCLYFRKVEDSFADII
jgi:lipopolysaccharide transport system permease protein